MAEPTFLLAYGTLRRGGKSYPLFGGSLEYAGTVYVPGTLYDLGWFPGIILGDTSDLALCDKFLVNGTETWYRLDDYEGFHPFQPLGSLFIRKELYPNTFIYEYNRPFRGAVRVDGGDWLEHLKERYETTENSDS